MTWIRQLTRLNQNLKPKINLPILDLKSLNAASKLAI